MAWTKYESSCQSKAFRLTDREKRTLVGIARAHADIANIARLHDIMQCLHRLLDRRIIIEAMAPVQVDVIQLEALQTSLDGSEYILSAQAILIDVAVGIYFCWGTALDWRAGGATDDSTKLEMATSMYDQLS